MDADLYRRIRTYCYHLCLVISSIYFRGTMKIERSLKIQGQLITRLQDLYHLATTVHMTSQDMNERFNRLFEPYPKLPVWVREYVRGYRHALDDNLYRNHLQYGYEWQGLVYPANWDNLPEELKEYLRKGNETIRHGHYWKKTLTMAGNDKPFFVTEGL